MPVTDAFFEFPTSEFDQKWVLLVAIEVSGFVQRAIPLAARVGDVQVEFIMRDVEGMYAFGLLRAFPQIGDVLKVGYLDTGLVDTNITYTTPVVT